MRVVFGDCTLDSDTREPVRGGAPGPLSPKAFRLFELLLENLPRRRETILGRDPGLRPRRRWHGLAPAYGVTVAHTEALRVPDAGPTIGFQARIGTDKAPADRASWR